MSGQAGDFLNGKQAGDDVGNELTEISATGDTPKDPKDIGSCSSMDPHSPAEPLGSHRHTGVLEATGL